MTPMAYPIFLCMIVIFIRLSVFPFTPMVVRRALFLLQAGTLAALIPRLMRMEDMSLSGVRLKTRLLSLIHMELASLFMTGTIIRLTRFRWARQAPMKTAASDLYLLAETEDMW